MAANSDCQGIGHAGVLSSISRALAPDVATRGLVNSRGDMSLALSGAAEPTGPVKEHRVEAFAGIHLIQYAGDFAKWRVFKEKFEVCAELAGVSEYLHESQKDIAEWSIEKDKVARKAIITGFADKVFETINLPLSTTPVNELYTALCKSCIVNTSQRIKELKKELWSHVANESEDIKAHINFVDVRVAELRSAEHQVSSTEHIDSYWTVFQQSSLGVHSRMLTGHASLMPRMSIRYARTFVSRRQYSLMMLRNWPVPKPCSRIRMVATEAGSVMAVEAAMAMQARMAVVGGAQNVTCA